MTHFFIQYFSLGFLLLLNSSCSHLNYLLQASQGHFDLLSRARPLNEIAQDPKIAPEFQSLLKEVPQILAFAQASGLKPTDNYQRYVQLDHPGVTAVVTAAYPLRLEAKTWWFPFAGTVPYLGFFDPKKAIEASKALEEEGLETYVWWASAYSTLGWFSDPLLSSMIDFSQTSPIPPQIFLESRINLIELLFHESLHASLYVPGESVLNESLACFVASRLLEAYIKDRPVDVHPNEDKTRNLELSEQVLKKREEDLKIKQLNEQWLRLMTASLDSIFKSKEISVEEKIRLKTVILSMMDLRIQKMAPWNNAKLLRFLTYGGDPESFFPIYQEQGGSMQAFLTQVRTLIPCFLESDKNLAFEQRWSQALGSKCRSKLM